MGKFEGYSLFTRNGLNIYSEEEKATYQQSNNTLNMKILQGQNIKQNIKLRGGNIHLERGGDIL